jgi:hypothetical protein
MSNRTSKKFSKVNYDKINNLHEYKEKKEILEKTKKKLKKRKELLLNLK